MGSSLAPWIVHDPPPGGAANVATEDAASAELTSKHRPWPLPSGADCVAGDEVAATDGSGTAVAPGAGCCAVAGCGAPPACGTPPGCGAAPGCSPIAVVRVAAGPADDAVVVLPADVADPADVLESVPHAAVATTTVAAIDSTADSLTFIAHPSKLLTEPRFRYSLCPRSPARRNDALRHRSATNVLVPQLLSEMSHRPPLVLQGCVPAGVSGLNSKCRYAETSRARASPPGSRLGPEHRPAGGHSGPGAAFGGERSLDNTAVTAEVEPPMDLAVRLGGPKTQERKEDST